MRKNEIKSTPLLDNLVMASPCSVPWDSMTGDDRKRLCHGCSKFVHNLSDMSKAEAETFLKLNGTTQCAIFYRRFDGTVLTDDCPVGLRRIRDGYRRIAKAAAGVIAVLVALPSAFAQLSADGHRNSNNSGNLMETLKKSLPLPSDSRSLPNANPNVYNNPAGGISIMPPQNNNTVQPQQNQPLNNTTQPQPKPKCVQPIMYPVEQKNMNTVALGYFKKGQQAEQTGHKQLAEFFYEKALDAYDKQTAGDLKFRQQIQQALQHLSTH